MTGRKNGPFLDLTWLGLWAILIAEGVLTYYLIQFFLHFVGWLQHV